METVNEGCARCGDVTELREIQLECGYAMHELPLPLERPRDKEGYSLRVCKPCRAEWMLSLETWFTATPGEAGNKRARQHFVARGEVATYFQDKAYFRVYGGNFVGDELRREGRRDSSQDGETRP